MSSQYAQTNRSVESFNRTVDGFRVIISRETWGDRPGKPSRFQALVQPKGDARLAIGDIRGSICETEADAVASAFAKLAQAQTCAVCGGSGLGEDWNYDRLDDAGRPTLKLCASCAGA